MADATLLPCPFCGGDDLLCGTVEGGDLMWGRVDCAQCSAHLGADTEEAAIEAWNTRQPQVPAEDVERAFLVVTEYLADKAGRSAYPAFAFNSEVAWAIDFLARHASITATEGDSLHDIAYEQGYRGAGMYADRAALRSKQEGEG